jgi:hypothetical protein
MEMNNENNIKFNTTKLMKIAYANIQITLIPNIFYLFRARQRN